MIDTSLANIDFEPLTEVKAKFSEKVAKVERENRLLVITLNGKPKVILLPYDDFLNWIQQNPVNSPSRRLSLSQWEKESKQRKAVARSIKNLFDFSILSRKGQKPYKQNALAQLK